MIPDWNSLDSVRRVHSDFEEAALFFFALLVLFDVLAHLSKTDLRKSALEKIGLCFFAVAVFSEIVAYPYGQRNDSLSAQEIGSLDAKATDAAGKSASAVTDSREAEAKSGEAIVEAGRADTASSSALALARGARTEADSFERDIFTAKQQAANAESNLADALERAATAEKEADTVNEKLADRALSDDQQRRIAGKMVSFAFQEYKVVAYWDSQESLGIANRIHQALQMARWKYLPLDKATVMLGGTVGVQVWHHPEADDSTKEAAKALVDALNAEGIFAYEKVENPTNNPKHNVININVGSKR